MPYLSYFYAFFSHQELITILKGLDPLIKDVKNLILEKIIDDIVNEEIRNISNIYAVEYDHYDDDLDFDIYDYY